MAVKRPYSLSYPLFKELLTTEKEDMVEGTATLTKEGLCQ
jgi:hypothetical protein